MLKTATKKATKKASKVMTEEQFRKLIYAAFNVGGNAQPDNVSGEAFSAGMLYAAKQIYRMLDGSGSTLRAYQNGVKAALKLFVETQCAANPAEYAEKEIERGLDGKRHEFENALIAIPEKIKFQSYGTV